ncbi:hypothetical protein LCGC14_1219880 [marine sediment metagenome]|uniref:Uncharacterized protein n=1 Tax=marine sediment metagenome TaxID=412755 RepID=A0A0F9NTY0_9ZZZZ
MRFKEIRNWILKRKYWKTFTRDIPRCEKVKEAERIWDKWKLINNTKV